MSESIKQKGSTQKGWCHLHEEHRKSRSFEKIPGFNEEKIRVFNFSSATHDKKQRNILEKQEFTGKILNPR